MKVIAPLFINAALLAVATRQLVDNEEHLVIPVIAAREGVMNNVFYSSDELGFLANRWNGMPVTVGHPKVGNDFVSAHDVGIADSWTIGYFTNVKFEAATSALKGDILININKAKKLGHESIVDSQERGEPMDVSTGMFAQTIPEPGLYNNEAYNGKATSIIPDHLALLPNSRGACSQDKGCGTFLHNHDHDHAGGACCDSCADKARKAQKPRGLLANLSQMVLGVFGIKTNELSHEGIRDALRAALKATPEIANIENCWPYILDVFEAYFVYEVDGLLYKQSYSINSLDQVELEGSRSQVVISRQYVEVTSVITNEQTPQMTPKITAILASALATNAISAEDHSSLSKLPDGVLDKVVGFTALGAGTSAAAPTAPVVNASAPSALSAEDAALLAEIRADREIKTNSLRAKVKKAFPKMEEALITNMAIPVMEGMLAGLNDGGTDFSLSGGAPSNGEMHANSEDYEPPSVLLAAPEASK